MAAALSARGSVGIVVARSRMLPSVRPVMQRWFAAGLYGSSRAGSKSPKACSKRCGKPWFSQPRLADCCAILSFRPPYALTVATSLRRHGRSPINTASDQKSPDHARHLVGQGHSDQHFRLAWQHPCQPRPGRRATETGLSDHRTGPKDKRAADGPFSVLRYSVEFLPPVDFCSGVSPSQAAKSRPARKPAAAGASA